MVILSLCVLAIAIGCYLYVRIFDANPATRADDVLILILIAVASVLIAVGITVFCQQVQRLKRKKRAELLAPQDFFLFGENGQKSNTFDFQAYLFSLGAKEIQVTHGNQGYAECQIGKYKFYLRSWLADSGGGNYQIYSQFEKKRRREVLSSYEAFANGRMIRSSRTSDYRDAIFAKKVFEAWRREVEATAAEARAKKSRQKQPA